jgi:hypothetical protein
VAARVLKRADTTDEPDGEAGGERGSEGTEHLGPLMFLVVDGDQ